LISVPVTLGLVALEATDGTIQPLPRWGEQYGYVIVVSAVLTTAAWGVEQLVQKPAAAPQAAAAGGAETFLQRLPLRLRSAELYAIESEDHYLRVHTSAGQELILMRLADAVRELAGVEGLRTHRSWWVAKQGLADIARGDGRLVLKLKSGAEAPVSRTYLKAVRDAGWV
jgi:DNA-binding LytR/AlgR family response regulator